MSEYSRIGYIGQLLSAVVQESLFTPKTPEIPESQLPDQTGNVWIVTGSTSGIGFEVARKLAELGAHVWIVGRTKAKAQEHADLIRAKHPAAKVDILVMDLSDLATIKPGLEPFLRSGLPLNGVVHNAGMSFPPAGTKTAQGHDLQLGTNCLGPWLIQRLLDPVLIKSSVTKEGRIVWVSSTFHLSAPYSGDAISKDPFKLPYHFEGYGLSKAINAMQSIQWTRSHPNANVKSVSVHPGAIKTNIARHMGSFTNWFMGTIGWPAIYGAYSELGAALGDVQIMPISFPGGE